VPGTTSRRVGYAVSDETGADPVAPEVVQQEEAAQPADPARAALDRAKADARRRGARSGPARRGPRPGSDRAPADGPERFGTAIRRLVDERGWTQTVQAGSVLGRWDVLVGAGLAAHCRPERLTDGELVLVAESTAWATQVRLLAPAVLARLAGELGAGVVTSLRVHGPTAPDWSGGPRRVSDGRGPRDTYG